MLANIADFKTYELSTKVILDGEMPALTGVMSGGQEKQEMRTVIDVEGDIQMEEEEVYYDLDVGIAYDQKETDQSVKGNIKFYDQAFYLKVAEVPSVEGASLDSMLNQWYKFDMEKMASMVPVADDVTATEQFDLKQYAKLKKLLKKQKFIKVTKDFGVQKLYGNDTYHYQVTVDPGEFINFMLEANQVMEGEEMSTDEQQELRKNAAKLEDIDFEVWIGKKDYNLHRLQARGENVGEDGAIMKYDVGIDFSDFDKKIEIDVPADAKEFNLMEMLMPSMAMPGGENFQMDLEELNKWSKDLEERYKDFDPVEVEKQMQNMKDQFQDMDWSQFNQ